MGRSEAEGVLSASDIEDKRGQGVFLALGMENKRGQGVFLVLEKMRGALDVEDKHKRRGIFCFS